MRPLHRRHLLRAAAVCAAPWIITPSRGAETVRVGQTAAYTGAFGELGTQYSLGIKAAIDQFNAANGARRVEWIALDDKLDPKLATENARQLVEDKRVATLLGIVGTGVAKALIPYCEDKRVPMFALTGDDGLRAMDQRFTYFSSASYGSEARAMVRHAATLSRKSVFVIHTDLPAGKGWAEEAKASAAEHKIEYRGAYAAKPDGSDAKQAAQAFLDSKADCVAMVYAGAGVKLVLEELFAAHVYAGSIYVLSQGATPKVIELIRSKAQGLIVSQVVPNPYSAQSPLVPEYLAGLKSVGAAPNYLNYQGYLLGRVYLDAMARITGTVTPQSMVQALNEKPLGYKRYVLDYSGGKRLGTQFSDMSMLRTDGRFVS